MLNEIKHGRKSRIPVAATLFAGLAMLLALACAKGADVPQSPNGTNGAEFVEIAAPIESVEIVKVAAKSPNASLVIVSGGLNSCESFKDYKLTKDGEVYRVQVTNLRTAASNAPCTAIYGTQQHSIPLPSNEIAGCETYQVEVNGTMFSVEASCPAPATGPSTGEMLETLAPILSAEVAALESFPVQYMLLIESALPNGCIEFGGYQVSREGATIKVRVTNQEPADKDVMCTQQYRTVKTTVSLGTGLDYEPATAYTVEVNDVSTGFVTDAAAPGPSATGPSNVGPGLGEAFDLKVGETATIGSEGFSSGLSVELTEIVEDSRCPSDVTCVWAGRAIVRVIVSSPGDVLGFGAVELALEAGDMDAEGNRAIGDKASYELTLLELAPHPISSVQLNSGDYLATLEVVKVPFER